MFLLCLVLFVYTLAGGRSKQEIDAAPRPDGFVSSSLGGGILICGQGRVSGAQFPLWITLPVKAIIRGNSPIKSKLHENHKIHPHGTRRWQLVLHRHFSLWNCHCLLFFFYFLLTWLKSQTVNQSCTLLLCPAAASLHVQASWCWSGVELIYHQQTSCSKLTTRTKMEWLVPFNKKKKKREERAALHFFFPTAAFFT